MVLGVVRGSTGTTQIFCVARRVVAKSVACQCEHAKKRASPWEALSLSGLQFHGLIWNLDWTDFDHTLFQGGHLMISPSSPQDLIFQELSSFAATHDMNLGVKELKAWAFRVYDRLNGQLISHKQAAAMLGVCMDMLHIYRKDGLIVGIPKNPNAQKKHWLYQITDVLELKTYRTEFQRKRGQIR